MTYQPPKCPNCGNVLDHVDETEYNVYTFSEQTGGWYVIGTITVSCPYCEYDPGKNTEDFESGACNYQAEDGGKVGQ